MATYGLQGTPWRPYVAICFVCFWWRAAWVVLLERVIFRHSTHARTHMHTHRHTYMYAHNNKLARSPSLRPSPPPPVYLLRGTLTYVSTNLSEHCATWVIMATVMLSPQPRARVTKKRQIACLGVVLESGSGTVPISVCFIFPFVHADCTWTQQCTREITGSAVQWEQNHWTGKRLQVKSCKRSFFYWKWMNAWISGKAVKC